MESHDESHLLLSNKDLLLCNKEELVKHIMELRQEGCTRSLRISQQNWNDREKQQKEINELKKQIEDLNEHRADHLSCVDILLKENQTLKADYEDLEEQLEDETDDALMEILDCEHSEILESVKDLQKKIKELKKQNEELKEDISVLNDDKEELFDAWLHYWSDAQLGCEHSIPMSQQEGGKYQILLDELDY